MEEMEAKQQKQEKRMKGLQLVAIVTGIAFPLYALVLAALQRPPSRPPDPAMTTLYANVVAPLAEIGRDARSGSVGSLFGCLDKLTAGFAAIDPLLTDSGRVHVAAMIDSLKQAAAALVVLSEKNRKRPVGDSLSTTIGRLGSGMSLAVRGDLFPRNRRQ